MPVKTIVTGNQINAFPPRRGKFGAGAVNQGAGNATGARLNIHRADIRRKVDLPVKIIGNHAQTPIAPGSSSTTNHLARRECFYPPCFRRKFARGSPISMKTIPRTRPEAPDDPPDRQPPFQSAFPCFKYTPFRVQTSRRTYSKHISEHFAGSHGFFGIK